MHTLAELQEKQALPLDLKIRLTKDRVRAWINEYGEDGVYISFSGGKDSTVLLDLVRNEFGYKNVPACFVDVPTQYPELRSFVKTFDNVDIVTPKINFFQVCEKYGFPLFSKEISESVEGARKYLTSLLKEQNALTNKQTNKQPYSYFYDRICGQGKYAKTHAGGGDNKYRKVRGIGEYSRNRQIQIERKVSNADGCLRSRLGQEEDGSYP